MKRLFLVALLCCVITEAYGEVLKQAPDFVLQEFHSKQKITLANLVDGKTVIVLSFFNTLCEPCKKEFPVFKSIQAKFREFTKLFLINLDENPERVLPGYIKQHQLQNIPILVDPGGYRCAEKYGVSKLGRVTSIPQLFVISKDGIIKLHLTGYHTDLEEKLTKILTELKSTPDIVQPEKTIISIIYTNSANGYLESCDCQENPFGGLARRVTAIKSLQSKSTNIITVDSGDTFPPRENKLLAEYCLKIMQFCNYDAVGIGDQELLNGVKFLEEHIDSVPFISANLQACDEKTCYALSKPYLIKEFGQLKVAVISVISKDVFALFPKTKLKDIKVTDHKEYLKLTIPQLRSKGGGGVDLVVVISHCGIDEDKELAKEIAGIDVIVGGHSQNFLKDPIKVNSTLIVQAGENGHRIGRLELELNQEKKIVSYKNEFVLLDKSIPDHEPTRGLITEYNTALKKQAEKFLPK